ncbi:MAG: glycoside hydrolase family 3 C-terminal domain-containing protein [Bacteroidales bacterium]|nr:glycoside hydrolase family 3 C-terminal domain-containing protein [Bacteroidales bacterium]
MKSKIASIVFIMALSAVIQCTTNKPEYPFQNTDLSIEERVNDLVSRMTLEEKISQMQNSSPAIPRLGIAEYNWWNECLHGVARNSIATVFPQAIGMAATWNPELIEKEADVISTEARAKHHEAIRNNERDIYKGLTMWSPNINIFRDPRWGRGQETYGEDPCLTSRIGVAFVKGLQGNDPKYFKVISTPKHYAVHSGPEPSRHTFNAQVSDRDLYETYLPAFKACIVEGGAFSIMGAYNRFRDEACCASNLLLKEILRNKWGFEGYVVSDCGAIMDIYQGHKMVKTAAEASAMAVKAGCDLTCGGEYYALDEAVEKDLIKENEIEIALKRLMTARFKLGMFDPPGKVPYARIAFSANDTEKHNRLALKVAQESMVLLKNYNNTLPLKKNLTTIAVIGPYADNLDILLGNYHGTPSNPVTILEGIKNKVSKNTKVIYAQGIIPVESFGMMETVETNNLRPSENQKGFGLTGEYFDNPLLIAEAIELTNRSDVTVVVAGISPKLEGEEMPVEMDGFEGGDRTHLEIPKPMQVLVKTLYATGKPVILVLTGGSALAVNWESEHISAILQVWYPGQQGGNAVADVLFGDYNPAGRLPVTFYSSVEDLPPFEDYNMEGRTYRYFHGEPLYPFGYGLSYSSFKYEKIDLSAYEVSENDLINVSVTLRNTGDYDGDEVVQLYVRDVESAETQPIKSLKGFKRAFLKKGETKTIEIPVKINDLSYYDEKQGDFVLEPGVFELQIGASSSDIRLKTHIIVREN